MSSGGNDFNYFKLTKLATFMEFKRLLMFCLADWGAWAPCSPPNWLRHCLGFFEREKKVLHLPGRTEIVGLLQQLGGRKIKKMCLWLKLDCV